MAPRLFLDYTEYLAREVQEAGGLSKGERTRLRIKAAASRILAKKGYHDLRMSDIAEEAKVSHGAVYRYFDNKREVTFEVLQGLGERTLELLLPAGGSGTAYQRIQSSTQASVDHFRANIGLMRCMRQLGDEYSEFDELTMRNNARWYRMVASGLVKRARQTDAARKQGVGVASALGGMVDELLHNVFVREDPTLSHWRRAPGQLVTMLSILWYRAVYGESPSAEEVGAEHWLLDLDAGDL